MNISPEMEKFSFLDAIFGYFNPEEQKDETDNFDKTPLDNSQPRQISEHAIIDSNDEGFEKITLEYPTSSMSQQILETETIDEDVFFEALSDFYQAPQMEDTMIETSEDEFFDAESELSEDEGDRLEELMSGWLKYTGATWIESGDTLEFWDFVMGKISTEVEHPTPEAEPTEVKALEIARPVSQSLQEKPLDQTPSSEMGQGDVGTSVTEEIRAEVIKVNKKNTAKSFGNMNTLAYWDAVMGRVSTVCIPPGPESLYEPAPMKTFHQKMPESLYIEKPMPYVPRFAKIVNQKDNNGNISTEPNTNAESTDKKDKKIKNTQKFSIFKKNKICELFDEPLLENEDFFKNDFDQSDEIPDPEMDNKHAIVLPKKKGLKRRILKIVTLSKFRKAIRNNITNE